jgi:phage shock protein PspC (stress-responsive transcriptional regulator)
MERIAVTVRLQGADPIPFESAAHERLERYLVESSELLEGDSDPQEILADLERAIAERCAARLTPAHTVVTLAELQAALDEIGSVQVAGTASTTEPPPSRPSPKVDTIPRLEQVSEGAVISGVCLGLARYFGFDATLMRLFAIVLLFVTGGGMIPVYAAMMLLMPYAPRQPGVRIGWLPAKSRELVEFIRSKFGSRTVATS